MTRITYRVVLAQLSLFVIFGLFLFGGLVLSVNLARWLSNVVPGRGQFFQVITVIIASIILELPIAWAVGLFAFKSWAYTCRSVLSPGEMDRLQHSLKRL